MVHRMKKITKQIIMTSSVAVQDTLRYRSRFMSLYIIPYYTTYTRVYLKFQCIEMIYMYIRMYVSVADNIGIDWNKKN